MIQTQIDSVPTSAPAAVPQPANGGTVGVRISIIIGIDDCDPIVLPSIAKATELRDALNALLGQQLVHIPLDTIQPFAQCKVARTPDEWIVSYGKTA